MAKSKSSAGASPAKTSLRRASIRVSKPQGPDSGQSTTGLLARYNRSMRSWKMFGTFSLGKVASGLRKSSKTWPRSGTMRNGTVYRLPTLAPHTSGTAYGLLPTPLAGEHLHLRRRSSRAPKRGVWRYLTAGHQLNLSDILIARGYSALEIVETMENMMGFPENWTESKHSATQ